MSLPDQTVSLVENATPFKLGQSTTDLGEKNENTQEEQKNNEVFKEVEQHNGTIIDRASHSPQDYGDLSFPTVTRREGSSGEDVAKRSRQSHDNEDLENHLVAMDLSKSSAATNSSNEANLPPTAHAKETRLSILDEPNSEEVPFEIKPLPTLPGEPHPDSPAATKYPSLIDTDDNDPRPSLGKSSEGDHNMENRNMEAKEDDTDSKSEIQSIMDQFGEEEYVSDGPDMSSPNQRNESPLLKSPLQHPPRKSSLEPLRSVSPQPHSSNIGGVTGAPISNDIQTSKPSERPRNDSLHKASSIRSLSYSHSGRYEVADSNAPTSPMSPGLLNKSLPPAPDPEPDLPFDFHRFLDQLRHRTADPVAKFLRSFLVEFGKKQWMVHEQVKIISDFLSFITTKMAQCEVWREVSDAEFDNAKEGMEKLVMNRLYSQTFSPAIPPPVPVAAAKGKRKAVEKTVGPGRRGQHQEDIERDEILAQKVRIYGWVQEEHLDIPPVGESGKRFLVLAQQEILKMRTYRAPRDKIICVLNCCKVIFGLLRNAKNADTSADSFVPLLIYVVLKANPEHLVSNVQYILRFRNQDKLSGEAGYYLSSLMGAIQFIENIDRTALTISDDDFEKNVEAAVSAIAEREKEDRAPLSANPQLLEKSEPSRPEVTPRNSMEAERFTVRRPPEKPDIGGSEEEGAAVSGLLRSIQRPLSSIGRIFSEDLMSPSYPGNVRAQEVSAHPPETPRRLSPAVFQPPRNSSEGQRSSEDQRPARSPRLSAEDAAARQASAEAAEAQRIHRAEHKDIVDTLAGMFPDLGRDVIDDVVRMKEGRVGLAVDACLALNT